MGHDMTSLRTLFQSEHFGIDAPSAASDAADKDRDGRPPQSRPNGPGASPVLAGLTARLMRQEAAPPRAKPTWEQRLHATAKLLRPRQDSKNLTLPFNLYSASRDHVTQASASRHRAQAAAPIVTPMGAARTQDMEAKLMVATRMLYGGVTPKDAANAPPAAQACMQSDEQCAETIDKWFAHDVAHDVAAPFASMGTRLLHDFSACMGDTIQAREDALYAASALQSIRDPGLIWQHIVDDTPGLDLPLHIRRDIHHVLRVMARCEPSFDGLWRLKTARGHTDAAPGMQAHMRQALNAVDALIDMGCDLGEHSDHGLQDALAYARRRQAQVASCRIGGQEGKDLLACLALLHAFHCLQPDQEAAEVPPAALRSAAMAWRNGFCESGPGTDFNRALHRLHAFVAWIARAGDSTRMTRVRQSVSASMGRKLSPLSAMTHGLMGAELPELATEAAQRQIRIRQAIGALRDAVAAKAHRLRATLPRDDASAGSTRQSSPSLSANWPGLRQCVVQEAMLTHWYQCDESQWGDKLCAAQRRNLLDAIKAAHPDLPLTAAQAEAALRSALTPETLSQWARFATNWQPHGERTLLELIDSARTAPAPDTRRAGRRLSLARMRALALQSLDAEGVQFRHDASVGIDPALNIDMLSGLSPEQLSAGLGCAVRLTQGRSASVRIGTATLGSSILLATERRRTGRFALYAYAGHGIGNAGHGLFKIGALAGGRYGEEHAQEVGVSIRVSKRIPDHKAQCAAVLNFLFDQVEQGAGSLPNAVDLWEHFSTRFLNTDVSFSFVDGRSKVLRAYIGAAGGLSWGLSDTPYAAGARLALGYEVTHTLQTRRESPGMIQSRTASEQLRKQLPLQASVGGNVSPFADVLSRSQEHDAPPGMPAKLRAPALPILSWRTECILPTSEAGQLRITREHGRVQAQLSLAHREFRTGVELQKHLLNQKQAWEQALAGAPGGGQAALDAFIQDMHKLPKDGRVLTAGNRVFMERRHLSNEAAARLTFLDTMHKLSAGRHGLSAEAKNWCQDLGRQAAVLVARADSWLPEKLAVTEVSTAYTDHGLDYLLVLRTRLQATSTNRYLLQLKPTP